MNETKSSLWFCLTVLLLLLPSVTRAEKIALINGTVINPATARIEPATVLIDGDRITAVDKTAKPSAQDTIIDCKGKYILPGYIDTHIHFFQSGGLYTRPDGVDLGQYPILRERDCVD